MKRFQDIRFIAEGSIEGPVAPGRVAGLAANDDADLTLPRGRRKHSVRSVLSARKPAAVAESRVARTVP
jgi:hypothetical protein